MAENGETVGTGEQGVFALCYRSRALISGDFGSPDCPVLTLGREAAAKNAACGVTGALVYRDGMFAQTLEGPREAVVPLYGRILRDRRHADVTKIWSMPRDTRFFPDWSMWLVNLHDHAFAWLASGGEAPAASGLPERAVQDLRAMRLLVTLGV